MRSWNDMVRFMKQIFNRKDAKTKKISCKYFLNTLRLSAFAVLITFTG